MSTLAEIEEAIEHLPAEQLPRVEAVLRRRMQAREGVADAVAALDALQSHLALDDRKSRDWRDAVWEARR